jgi:hypothetical protein
LQQRAFAFLPDDAGAAQMTQVVGEGGCGNSDLTLDIPDGPALVPGTHQQAHDAQTGLVAELVQQRCGGVEIQCHG